MFARIKKYLLKKDISSQMFAIRKRKISTFTKARTIAFIAEVFDEDTCKEIVAYISQLRETKTQVFLLAYINDKTIPPYCLPQYATYYFCRKQLNFYEKPIEERCTHFIEEEFDLLIDYTQGEHAPISYILQLSHARFIVGTNSNNSRLYDLFLCLESHPKLADLSEMIDNYTHKLIGTENAIK